jgi:ribonuclease-3
MKTSVVQVQQHQLLEFCRCLGHKFDQVVLLELALTHRSYGAGNNERLEFLGDAIVNFVVAEAVYQKFPQAREGQLSRMRAKLVRGSTLAELARELKLGQYLKLGAGERKSGGQCRDSILADAMESTIGAIYLDAGLQVAQERILYWFKQRLRELDLGHIQKDPKTRLQEYLQARKVNLPVYKLIAISGEDHVQQFTIACGIELLSEVISATGSSRRIAEQKVAAIILIKLEQHT